MKIRGGAFLVIILALVSPSQAYALRCGTKLVNIGDRTHKVIHKCGQPTFKDEYEEVSAVYPYGTVKIEVWTYNFGSSRFMQELIFRNGVLHRINKLEYGY